MRSTIVTRVAAAAGVALALSACGSGSDQNSGGADVPGLAEPGEMSVCISKNGYPPLYWKEGATLTGFDVKSMEAIAADLEVKLTWTELAFNGLVPALAAGRCDLLRSGLYINAERKEVADAIPYLKTGPAILVPEGNPDDVESKGDLSGLTVAAQAASANQQILSALSRDLEASGKDPIDIAKYPELPETVAAVENGKADALIETDIAAGAVSSSLEGSLEPAPSVFEPSTSFGMFVPKESPLLKPLTKSVQKLYDDGTFAEIAAEFDIPEENLVPPAAE